jgi:ribulose-phosphate 3-epimerase
VTLSVGITAADPLHVGDQIDLLAQSGVGWLHVDVMDGRFCPQITVGPGFVAALPNEDFMVDVHLMVDDPLAHVDAFVAAGVGALTFHVEATRHAHRVLQHLAATGVKRGLALNPGTSIAAAEPLIDDLELLLLLAVNPGWSGQSFLPATRARAAAARELIGEREVLLGVDGGVTLENVADVATLGVDVIVAGSAVFAGGDVVRDASAMLAASVGA